MSNRQQIFTDIVENNKWEYYKQNEDHSLSGEGSSLYFTENIRKELPNLFTRYI